MRRPLRLLIALSLAGCTAPDVPTRTAAPVETPTPGPTATPTPTPVAPPEPALVITGSVRDELGQPAANVLVSAYHPDRTAETRTRPDGSFTLPSNVPVGLEAASGSTKAFQPGVAPGARNVTLTLAATGTIVGAVTAPAAPSIKDFTGVSVTLEGTPYQARCERGGTYRLDGVPAGSYTLLARRDDLGEARQELVAVQPRAMVALNALALAQAAPTVTAITPSAGGPGAKLLVKGRAFGDGPLRVTISGTEATFSRRDTQTLEVTVPENARSGELVVATQTLTGRGMPLNVLHSIRLSPAMGFLPPRGRLDLVAIGTTDSGATIPGLSVRWSLEGTAATIDDAGVVRAGATPGQLVVTAMSGRLEARLPIEVLASPVVVNALAGDGRDALADGPLAQASFDHPAGLALDEAGALVLADAGNHRVRRLSPREGVTTVAGAEPGAADGPIAQARFNGPSDVDVGPDRAIVVADRFNHAIRRIGPSDVSTLAGQSGEPGYVDGPSAQARFREPAALEYDHWGQLYVADAGNSCIRVIGTDGQVHTLAGAPGPETRVPDAPPAPGAPDPAVYRDGPRAEARFRHPLGLAVAGDGRLFVADTYNHCIRVIGTDDQVLTLAGTPGVAGYADGKGREARFDQPVGLVLDAKGNCYVADRGNHRVRRVAPDGTVTTLAGTGGAGGHADGPADRAAFVAPSGLVFDAAGRLILSEQGFLRHLQITATP